MEDFIIEHFSGLRPHEKLEVFSEDIPRTGSTIYIIQKPPPPKAMQTILASW